MDYNNIDTISKIQQYIEQNLNEEITLSMLAKRAGYSVAQFERIFKSSLEISPFKYISKLRLTAAAKMLRDGEIKVIDTALNFLFDSHEGFTRAFTKEFGVSPFRYKKKPIPLKYFIAYDVIARKSLLNKQEITNMKTRTIFTQVVQRPKRKVIIKRGKTANDYFTYCEEVDCEVWGVLCSIKDALFEPAGFWLPKAMVKPNTSEYVQGVEVPLSYSGEIPEGCELIELDAGLLMVFNSEEYDDEHFIEEINATWEAIAKYNPKTYGYEWDTTQPRFQLEPRGERGYIEARPVKKIK